MSQTKDALKQPVPTNSWQESRRTAGPDAPEAFLPGQLPTANHFAESAPPTEEDDPLLGEQVDKWILVRRIGQGGMALVYEAEHTWLAQKAAIKLLRPNTSGDLISLERFRREALMVSQLSHPNIIDIKDFGEDPEYSSYMVMELLDGQDLATFGPLPEAPAFRGWLLSVCQQVCDALDAIHEVEIVHRDLKPSNIFLVPGEPYPHVKLLDFGVAKATLDQSDGALTSTGLVLGTPHYLAPEQLKTRETLSAATDIYALGVVLFELLTGQLPLLGEGPFEHMLLVAQETPPAIGDIVPSLAGTALSSLVARMLEKKADKRPASGAAVMKALREAVEVLPHLAPGAHRSRTNPVTPPPSPSSLRSLTAAAQAPMTPPPNTKELKPAKPPPEATTTSTPPKQSNTTLGPASTAALPLPQAASPPQRTRRHWLWALALGLCAVLTGIGLYMGVYRETTPPPSPTVHRDTVPSKAPKPRAHKAGATLEVLLQRGAKAIKQKHMSAAIRSWSAATQHPDWRKHKSFPALYKRLAHAYAAQRNWYAALHFLKRYQKNQPPTTPGKQASRKERGKWEAAQGKQTKAAQQLLGKLRLQLHNKQWLLAYTTYQEHQRLGRKTPQGQAALVALLQAPFPSLALSHQRSLLRTGILDKRAREALTSAIRKRQRWCEQDTKRASSIWQRRWRKSAPRQPDKMRKYPLEHLHHHSAWLHWLRRTMKRSSPKAQAALWRWHVSQLERLHQTHRWPWLRLQHKRLPQGLERSAQRGALAAFVAWHTNAQKLHKAMVQGQLRAAQSLRPKLLQLMSSWTPHQTNASSWGISLSASQRQVRTWTLELPALLALQKEAKKLSTRARFAQANQRRRAWLALLRGHPAYAAIKRQLQRQQAREAHLQRQLKSAKKAYQRGQWQRARLRYKAFLKARPYAWNARTIKQRRKACRCALNLFPWEVCQRGDFPPHFRPKRHKP